MVVGCGLDLQGAPVDGVTDAAPATETTADSGSATSSAGLPDGGWDANTSADASIDAGTTCTADTSKDLQHCGACFAACPAGTSECTNGVCLAKLTIAVLIDGKSELRIKGSTMRWHHFEYDAPGRHTSTLPTTINGVAWLPSWPNAGSNVDCDCDSSATTILPALPARAQTATLTQTEGRDPVSLVQPTAANGYQLTIAYEDEVAGADDYEVTVTYDVR
jgi:hypothetical protein